MQAISQAIADARPHHVRRARDGDDGHVDAPLARGGRKNHAATVALYFMYYNVGRVHQTLRVTPAMEAGIADRVWGIEEIVGLLE